MCLIFFIFALIKILTPISIAEIGVFGQTEDVAHFFEQFLKIPPDKKYNAGRLGNHYSYLGTLFKMKIRLINEEYPEFCHELITLHHYENLLQRRIFFNIAKLYNIFIEVNNESDNKNL